MQLKCLDASVLPNGLDRSAYKFQHKLMGHPALTLENLGNVIPALPKGQVMYSARQLSNGDDFEATFKKRPQDRSIEETIESIRSTDSYVMVRSPEAHASFAPLYRDLIHDVETAMQEFGVGAKALSPTLFLFIASPNSVTPFHIDRYSTFLLQFRGSKHVTVFPPWDERVVTSPAREAYMAYANTRLEWSQERELLGVAHSFAPGDALHIPFAAGHHVRNGAEDVSISMSIIFNTPETRDWLAALRWNHWVRTKFGAAPASVPGDKRRDGAKSLAWRSFSKVLAATNLG